MKIIIPEINIRILYYPLTAYCCLPLPPVFHFPHPSALQQAGSFSKAFSLAGISSAL